MRWSLLRGIPAILVALACALPAYAAVVIDLSGVNTSSTRYTRFRSFVDAAVAGNIGYGFSATDAAYAWRIAGTASYCQLAVNLVNQQVTTAEAEIAAGRRP